MGIREALVDLIQTLTGGISTLFALFAALGISDWFALLALLVAVIALWALVREEQALRLGVTFHHHTFGSVVRVGDGPMVTPYVLECSPRGPGTLYDVAFTAWPASRVEFRGNDEGATQLGGVHNALQFGDWQATEPLPGEGHISRWVADSPPVVLKMKIDRSSKEPVWVGMIWQRPGLLGGFKFGGYRVQVYPSSSDHLQKWSRLRRSWVRYGRRGKNPRRHPAYGSGLQPSAPMKR